MDKCIRSLAPSLVGGSIDFSFKKKVSNVTSIEENIAVEKKRIAKNVEMALEAGGTLCITLLGEMVSYYSKELYYMAVRGSIEMRRYRPLVLEYLNRTIDGRESHLLKLLSEKPTRWDRHGSARDIKIEALRYFLSTYKGRAARFKKVLTKEEFLIVV